MNTFTFYHGNKNYSSWSMRAGLALELAGANYTSVAFHLGDPDVRQKLRPYSPTQRVPVLHHGDLVIYDSLAIAEYLAEQFPGAGLWPADSGARAIARSVVTEMHSGFPALRRDMPFNDRRASPGRPRADDVETDIERIVAVWRECRGAHASSGPFLFGAWCLADIFYAPVVSRFRTYDIPLDETGKAYAAAVGNHPHVRAWSHAAAAETWVESNFDL